MQNMHTRLIKKTSFAFFLSSLIASPASAVCPSGYGLTKEYDNFVASAAMLNYGVAYSPEYLARCDNSSSSYDVRCGNLLIQELQGSYVWIKPADPSIKAIMFEDLNTDNLSRFNLPKNFQDMVDRKWCEINEADSSSATCYNERKSITIYIPHQDYGNAIRKKIFVERRYQRIYECRMISF